MLSIESVHLRVSDTERSRDFYDLLAGGPAPVAFISDGVRREPSPRRATGLFHTALLYPCRAALGAALRRVVEARIPITGASDHGVSEAIYLDDPDGNGIELYRDRPREEWPRNADGSIDMFTAALDVKSILSAADESAVPIVGHVHFKAGELERSEAFWREEIGLETMARYGDQATFMAADGYHHHVGLNIWMSRGAGPTPKDLPGLDRVVLSGAGEPRELADPDGNLVEIRAAG